MNLLDMVYSLIVSLTDRRHVCPPSSTRVKVGQSLRDRRITS